MDNTKQNDWFVASLLSPEKSFQDFKMEGVTPDNTTINNRDDYKNDKKIQERFKDANGTFDEVQFNKFYNGAVSTYNKFANDKFDDTIKHAPEYFRSTSLIPKGGKVVKPFKVVKVGNPFEQTKGLQGLNSVGESKLSVAELAQKNMVKDSKTGSNLGWSPNEEGGLFSIFTKPTVAIAQYDEDGVVLDAMTGKLNRHKKGEFKLNEDGKFFYETIGKRDPAGKQILSIWDSNTVDGSFANKFDFMDSDDKEKSIGGAVVKTIARVAPLFIPVVGEYYAGATIGSELLEVLPILAQSGASLIFGEDQKNKDYYKSLTSMRSFKRSMDTGVSEYSKQHTFTTENMLQMVGDVFGQLKQQKLIASIPQKIGWAKAEAATYRKGVELYGDDFTKFMTEKGYNNASLSGKLKMMEETIPNLGKMIRGYDQLSTTWAMGLSNMYMASTSAAGVVDDARINGLSEKETAALFLGTMAGYSTMMAKFEIGHWAIKGLGLDETGTLIKKAVKENAKQVGATLKSVTKEPVEIKKLNKLFSIGKSIGGFVTSKVTNIDDYAGAMIGEGLEEVTEEAMADGVKTIYNGLSAMGVTPSKDKGFKFSGEEMVQRYAMSLLGGALGGSIFKASERMSQNTFDNKDEQLKHDLIHLIRNGHGDEIIKTLDKYEKKGLLGSTDLSMDLDESSDVKEGLLNYKPSSGNSNSQNTYIANILKAEINTVKNIIFQEGVPTDEMISKIYNDRMQGVIDFNINTSIRDDVNDLTSNIISLKNDIASLRVASDTHGKVDESLVSKINEKEKQLADARFELQKIATGENYEKYLSAGLFNVNTALNAPFSIKDKNKIALQIYNKPLNELSKEESAVVDEEYKTYINSDRRADLKIGKEKFDNLFKSVSGFANQLNEYGDQRYGYYAQALSYEGTMSELNRPDEELPTVNKNIVELGAFNPATIGENDIETLNNILNTTPYLDVEIKKRIEAVLKNVKLKDTELAGINTAFDLAVGNMSPEGMHVLNDENTAEFFKDIYMYDGLPRLAKFNEYTDIQLDSIDEFKDNMLEYYNSKDFEEELEDLGVGDFSKDDFIRALNTFVESVKNSNQELIGKVMMLKNSMKGKKASPIQELIGKINLSNDDSDSKSVFDLLDQEVRVMNDKSDLSQYIIENQVTSNQIDIAVDTLNQLESAINGASDFTYREGHPNGYISAINKFKEDSKEPLLKAITIRANVSLISDINILRSKLLFLRKLSQLNQESKIKNQKASGLMAQGLFFKLVSQDEDIREKLTGIGINLKSVDAITEATDTLKNIALVIDDTDGKTSLDITNEMIINAELELTKIESELFNQFSLLKAKDKEVIHKLNSIFDPVKIGEMDATEFTSLTRTLKEYDKFVYLNTILNSDSRKFKKELYGESGEVLADGKFAPFFSQEYYSRIFFWMLEDRFSYNTAIHYFKRPKITDSKDPNYEIYKDHLESQLYNSLLIYGRPGVGKTTGTINIIGKLLSNRGLNMAVFGPSDKQGNNLYNGLYGSSVANAATGKGKEDIMKLFINESAYEKLKEDRSKLAFTSTFIPAEDSMIKFEKSESGSFLKPILNKDHVLIKDLFSGNNNSSDILIEGMAVNTIIIDEITHYSTDEIEIIHQGILNYNKTHKENPISLILAGDPNQSGTTTNGFTTNINFFKGITGPYLSISMRAGYNLKSNNLDASFSILNALTNLQKENNNRTTETQIQEFIESPSNLINLKYSQEEIFVGDKITDQISKVDLDKMLSNTTDKIGVISTDNDNDLIKLVKSYPDYETKFDIKTPESVQGLEYDYVLIDVENPNAKDNIRNAGIVAKSLNTLLSRSRIGSIITNRTVNGLNITSDSKDAIVVKTELPKAQIEEFKTLRNNSLKNTLENTDENTNKRTEEPPIESESEKTEPIETSEDGETILPPTIETDIKTEAEDFIEPEYNEPEKDVLEELRAALIGVKNQKETNRGIVQNNDVLYDNNKSFMFPAYDRLGINVDASFGKPLKVVNNDKDFGFLYSVIYGKEATVGDVIPVNEYKYISQELKKFKGALYQYSITKKVREQDGKDYNITDHLKAYNIDRRILNAIDIDSAKVGVLVKYFNLLTDKSFSLSEDHPAQTKGGLGRFIVVEFETNEGENKSITIGSLPSPYIENNKVKGNATNVPSNIIDSLKSIDRIFEDRAKGFDSNFETVLYFKNDFNDISKFSNIRLQSLGTDANGYRIKDTLETFKEANKHLVISNPYIFSGSKFTMSNGIIVEASEESLLTDNIYNTKIVGKPVVLVSNDKTLRADQLKGYLENQIKESIEEHKHRIEENKIRTEKAAVGESYTQKEFERRYPDAVKMIPLDVNGSKFSDWYKRQLELINSPKSTPDKILQLKMSSDKFIGARLYNSIYNFVLDINYIKENSKINYDNDVFSIIPNERVKPLFDYYVKTFGGFKFPIRGSYRVGFEGVVAFQEHLNDVLKTTNEILSTNGKPLEIKEGEEIGRNIKERRLKSVFDSMPDNFDMSQLPEYTNTQYNHTYTLFNALKTVFNGGNFGNVQYRAFTSNSVLKDLFNGLDTIIGQDFPSGIYHNTITLAAKKRNPTDDIPFIIETENPDSHYSIDIKIIEPTIFANLGNLETLEPGELDMANANSVDAFMSMHEDMISNIEDELGSFIPTGELNSLLSQLNNIANASSLNVNKENVQESFDNLIKISNNLIESYLDKNRFIDYDDNVYAINLIGLDDIYTDKFELVDVTKDIKKALNENEFKDYKITYENDGSKLKATAYDVESKIIATFEFSNGGLKTNINESSEQIAERISDTGNTLLEMISSSKYDDKDNLGISISRIMSGDTKFTNDEKKSFTDGMSKYYSQLDENKRLKVKELTEEFTNRISCL